jgi:hypothetical protein
MHDSPVDYRPLPSAHTTVMTSAVPAYATPSYSRPTSEPLPSQQSGPRLSSNALRCSLNIRQQPRAARAGPDGKDRRPIDPPPILQLMMAGFDPTSAADLEELQSQFVVHCRLVSANSPRRDVSTLAAFTEDGSREVQRLLLGTYVASPFHTKDDPDPETMPSHPPIDTSQVHPGQEPSSTASYIERSGSATTNMPGSFFIFADLSVRKAGDYRLEFSLMKMDPAFLMVGEKLPVLHTIISHAFRVVNAKDFDQVQPSTGLVKGLIERGAGFPLKLKKGTREGGRRRPARGDGESASDDEADAD